MRLCNLAQHCQKGKVLDRKNNGLTGMGGNGVKNRLKVPLGVTQVWQRANKIHIHIHIHTDTALHTRVGLLTLIGKGSLHANDEREKKRCMGPKVPKPFRDAIHAHHTL